MVNDESRRGARGPRRVVDGWPQARDCGGLVPARLVASGRLGELVAEAAHAGRLAGTLLAAPRFARVRMIAEDARYHLPSLARLLAQGAEEQLDTAPSVAEEYAELAAWVSRVLPPATPEEGKLRAMCAWLLAKAQLRAGKPEAAEASFAGIYRDIEAGGDGGRALAWAGLAQLRWQQRRRVEAWALLAVGSRLFAERQDAEAECACRSLCGFLLLGYGEPRCAQAELRAAHGVLERSQAPSLEVLLCLALAHCEVALGGPAAPDFLSIAREAARACATPVLGLGTFGLGAWWAAVNRVGRKASEAEEEQVATARLRALADGAVSAAARATLWLAMRRIAAERGEVVAALAAPLAELGEEGWFWGEEIRALASLAVERPAAYVAAARELALRLAADAIPALAAECPPRRLCDLADRLLLHRLKGDGPLGDLGGRSR